MSRYERTQAEDIRKLPPGKHSVKGIGKTEPTPEHAIVREDGVEIPLGKGRQVTKPTSLLYNEYPFLNIEVMINDWIGKGIVFFVFFLNFFSQVHCLRCSPSQGGVPGTVEVSSQVILNGLMKYKYFYVVNCSFVCRYNYFVLIFFVYLILFKNELRLLDLLLSFHSSLYL